MQNYSKMIIIREAWMKRFRVSFFRRIEGFTDK
jgi:hypothetical protein